MPPVWEKLQKKMALKRLKYRVGPLHLCLYAYQKGIGNAECITAVLSCISNRSASLVFLDFEKAFDLASPAAILISLVRKGIKGHLMAWSRNYLKNRLARVKSQGVTSEYNQLIKGTPQGGILSPFLFNMLMKNIAYLQLPKSTDIFIYADDVCVCVVVRGPRKVVTMQRALDIIAEKSAELGLKINIDKTKAMMLKAATLQARLIFNQTTPQWVNQYMYLGIHMDSQQRFNKELAYLREKASARLNTMKCMISLSEGANLQVQRLYCMACTRSLIDYATPALTHLTESQKASL